VSDITVSRQHALLMECGNNVYLKDSDSKFGTFQMIRKLKKLKPKQEIAVQIERKVFFIKVDPMKSGCPFIPCFKKASPQVTTGDHYCEFFMQYPLPVLEELDNRTY